MIYEVILTQKRNMYWARVKQWPEVVVRDKSRQVAIQRVRQRLIEYLTLPMELVQIELDLPSTKPNPWLQNFGRFKDDPTFEDLQTEIVAYRQAVEATVA